MRREKSSLRKRWDVLLDTKWDFSIQSRKCCKKLKCFQNCKESYLHLDKKLAMRRSQDYRRRKLMFSLTSEENFFSNNPKVCHKFLSMAFRFTNRMQENSRTCMTKRLALPKQFQLQNGKIHHHDLLSEVRQRAAVLSFLTELSKAESERMPHAEELHLSFFRERTVYDCFNKNTKTFIMDHHRPFRSSCILWWHM